MSGFEIFKVENGAITWLQSASTIKTAQAQIAAGNHEEYVVCGNTRYQKKRIFLVGYDATQLKAIAELLSRLGHEVFAARGNQAAMTALRPSRESTSS
jgi:PleD family two-component response regulator